MGGEPLTWSDGEGLWGQCQRTLSASPKRRQGRSRTRPKTESRRVEAVRVEGAIAVMNGFAGRTLCCAAALLWLAAAGGLGAGAAAGAVLRRGPRAAGPPRLP